MKVNRSVPPATVVPILVYPDVRAAVTFLTVAFGFVERTRIGESHRAQLAVGDDGAVIIADVGGERRPPQSGGVTHLVRVRVADVDAAFARARDHGAVVLEAPVDREYGERDCTLECALRRFSYTRSDRIRTPVPEFSYTVGRGAL
jgi:uncharacterized glyoxalase superfamily protein PhnB